MEDNRKKNYHKREKERERKSWKCGGLVNARDIAMA